jgi:hypothetical protein
MQYAKNYLVTGILPVNGVMCGYDADLLPPKLPPDLGSTSRHLEMSELITVLR